MSNGVGYCPLDGSGVVRATVEFGVPRSRILSALAVVGSWVTFLMTVSMVPRGRRIDAALVSLIVSGALLVVINARRSGTGKTTAAYRFLLVWGVSLPLLVTYISALAEGDTWVLSLNVIFCTLLFAWAVWTLEALARGDLEVISLAGVGLVAPGVLVTAATWGSVTLGERPMMPYLAYMETQPGIYVGLLLIALGLILYVVGEERDRFSGLART